MDFGAISAALGSLGTLRDLANGLVSVRDEAKLTAVKIDLLNEVISLQQTVLTLQQDMSTLSDREREAREEIRKLREQADQREEQELFEVRPGAWVKARKPADGEAHKPPYFCQACSADGKETALRVSGFGEVLSCSRDAKHNIDLDGHKPMQNFMPPTAQHW